MSLYFTFGNFSIPAYGCMIALGVVLANLAALLVLRKYRLDFNDLIILEAYAFLGGFLGAKLLYLLVSFRDIDWSRITDLSYVNSLMQSGFVFYGGLIGGLLMVLAAGRLHRIDAGLYIRRVIFLIPFIHSFGRIGCFCAGCCYGRPYDGPGAVIFPEGSYAPAGILLFPVQLLEAGLLMMIAVFLLFLQLRKNWYYTIETYLIMYAITRFVLEFFRYDAERGLFLGISTSQWISFGMIAAALLLIFRGRRGRKR